MSYHQICPCGHDWIGHRIAAPHPCKTCTCNGWFGGGGAGGRRLPTVEPPPRRT